MLVSSGGSLVSPTDRDALKSKKDILRWGAKKIDPMARLCLFLGLSIIQAKPSSDTRANTLQAAHVTTYADQELLRVLGEKVFQLWDIIGQTSHIVFQRENYHQGN